MFAIWGTALRRRFFQSRLRVAGLFALTAAVTVLTIELIHGINHLRHAHHEVERLLQQATLTLLSSVETHEHLLESGDTLAFLEGLRRLPLPHGLTWEMRSLTGSPVASGGEPQTRPSAPLLSHEMTWTEPSLGTFTLRVSYPLPLQVRQILRRSALEILLFLPLAALVGLAVGWVYAGWSLREVDNALRRYDHILIQGAHDLKTPLSILRLELGKSAPSRTRMQAAVRRLEHLSENILFLAEGSFPSSPRESVDLFSRVKETLDLFREEIRLKRLAVTLSGKPGMLRVEADPHALDRMLQNLVDNALHYTPEGGSIHIWIKGNTLGMENTVSAEPAPTTPHGLGWAVIREVARMHGWTVRRASSRESYRVWVSFPAI